MSSIFYYFLMAIGLSMDAFSLAIIYGTNGIDRKKIILLSLVVGIFHFIMPNLGGYLSHILLTNFRTYSNLISGIVFIVLGVEMILSFKEEDTKNKLGGFLDIILFAIAVSIDSFSVGIVLSLDNKNIITAGIIFSIISATFTFLGLILGKFLSDKVGKISKIIGIIILFLLALKSLFIWYMF